jgi:hypothetical protein
MFAGRLTIYTTRHTKISCSLARQCSQVDLPSTPPDTLRSAAASHVNVRRSTYLLHHQTHQDQLQPRTSMFAGRLTIYTTRHTKISCSLARQCSQVDLPTTPPGTPRSAAASHVNVRRSTYRLHHQTHQDQLQPCTSMFAGRLTSYTTRHTEISCSLAHQCSQVDLPSTPPDTPRSAAASHVNVCRSTYLLHHQTHQDQLQPRTSMFAGRLTSYTTRHTKISCSLANVRRSTYLLHHQAHQDQLQPRTSIFADSLTSYDHTD